MAFEIGDVVELKSGGPRMTVGAFVENRVLCVWFKRCDDVTCTCEFRPETLKKSEQKDG